MAIINTELAQRSPEWHKRREAKITGTLMTGVLGGAVARETAKYDVIGNLLTVAREDLEDMKPMERGTFLEDEATAAFEYETGFRTIEVGFVESSENPLFAQSPDRYIMDDNGQVDETAALEIKCLGAGKHIRSIIENKVPKEYDGQVMGYFTNNPKLNTLYFELYNPEMPKFMMHIITIKREDMLPQIEEAMIKINAFEQEVFKELEQLGIKL